MNMDRLADALYRHEAFRQKPYRCSTGKLTIGIGRNLDDKGISLSEAKFLLANDIHETIEWLRKLYWWFDELDDVRQEVVVNMGFNLGQTRFAGFKRMINAISESNFTRAAAEMLDSKWARQVGHRAQELARMMASGIVE